jgi:hypothetical protein
VSCSGQLNICTNEPANELNFTLALFLLTVVPAWNMVPASTRNNDAAVGTNALIMQAHTRWIKREASQPQKVEWKEAKYEPTDWTSENHSSDR